MKKAILVTIFVFAASILLCGASLAAAGKPAPGSASGVSDSTIPADLDLSCPITEEDLPAEDMARLSPSARAALLSIRKGEFYCTRAQELWEQGDVDGAVQSLDMAYQLLLRADAQDKGKSVELIQLKEDLRVIISQRLVEIYATRYVTAQGENNGILMPGTDNKYVNYEIGLLTGIESGFFKRSYARSGMYRPMILEKLKRAGLPEELSWLPLIESGFKDSAFSPARALGLWQFIPSTGIRFGLSRDKFIDERMDPEKATDAAIKYLQALHNMFGDWITCLAAYNCGEGRIIREINKKKIPYLDNFWDLYENLPRETARYVPRFFATLMIIKDPAKYGMELPALIPPPRYKVHRLTRQVHLMQIARAIGFEEADLVTLNPELKLRMTPSEPYDLRLPQAFDGDLLAMLDVVPEYNPPKPTYTYHTVQVGDTLTNLSRRYGISVSTICLLNGLRAEASLYKGKVLKIPSAVCEPPVLLASADGSTPQQPVLADQPAEKVTVPPPAPKPESVDAVEPRQPDEIQPALPEPTKPDYKSKAAKAREKAERERKAALEEKERLKKEKEKERLKKEKEREERARKAAAKPRTSILSHTVEKGDTIFNLAQRYNTTIPAIVKANDLPSKRIKIGQTLKVPTSKPPEEKKAAAKTYKVKKGDTAISIARKHDMTLSDFLKLNKFGKKTKVKRGETVKVE